MDQNFIVACIQNCAENQLDKNLRTIEPWIRTASMHGAQLICLPENFACIGRNDQDALQCALPEQNHKAIEFGRSLARELGVWLLLGSVTVRISADKVNNRSLLIDAQGAIVAIYNKLHLFDVQLTNSESYRESNTVAAGDRAVLANTPWGKLGMTICYDLRFPYLYRALAQAGADFISVPAAFTQTTGVAHWHTLIRARAIETGCYVLAPGQCGVRSFGRATYGHSLIVDPWGEILADGGSEPGFILAEIHTKKVREARRRIPSLEHDRQFNRP